jgi:hypothetical protein
MLDVGFAVWPDVLIVRILRLAALRCRRAYFRAAAIHQKGIQTAPLSRLNPASVV